MLSWKYKACFLLKGTHVAASVLDTLSYSMLHTFITPELPQYHSLIKTWECCEIKVWMVKFHSRTCIYAYIIPMCSDQIYWVIYIGSLYFPFLCSFSWPCQIIPGYFHHTIIWILANYTFRKNYWTAVSL